MVAAPPMIEMIEAALWYSQRRTRIFPLYGIDHRGCCECGDPDCGSPGKHPRTEHGLKDASADESVIRQWWKQWPNANIGMPTGAQVGVVVIDVDPRHGGMEALGALLHEHGELPPTREVHTGGGGSHLFFRCPNPSPRNSTNVLGQGLDIRAEGGYVVVPPSLHASGQRYRWVEDHQQLPPAPLPEWVQQQLTHSGAKTEGDDAPDRIDVASVLHGVSEGQRDNALFRTASKLRYANVPIDMAERLILEAAAACHPPFPAEQARAKVASAYGRYDATLKDLDPGQGDVVQVMGNDGIRVVTACEIGPVEFVFSDLEKGTRDLDAEMAMRLLMPGTMAEPYKQRINLLSISARESCRRELEAIYGKDVKWAKVLANVFAKCSDAFLNVDRAIHAPNIALLESIDYLIAGMAPSQGTTIFFGAGSAAKTFLTMMMAICISKGIDFLGRPCEKRNVLFVDYETGEEVFGFRLGRLLRGMGYESTDSAGIYYWDAGGIPLLDQVEPLRQAADRHNCGCLVIDHAALACGTEPEKSDAALRVKRALGRIKLPAIMIAHITGDGERDPAQVLRPFGSVFWSNLARRTWYVNRVQDQESDKAELGLYCRKNNDGRKPGDFGVNLFFDGDNGPITYTTADLRRSPKLNAVRGHEHVIFDALVESLTVDDIQEVTGLSPSIVKNTLNQNPQMFQRMTPSSGGRGVKTVWARAL